MSKISLREGAFRLFRFNVLAFAMRLVSSAVVARVMGPAAMGVWLLLSLLPTYAEGFGRIKVDVASVYVLGKGIWSAGEVSAALNVIALVTGGFCVAVLLAGRQWITPWLFGAGGVEAWLFFAMVLMIPVHFMAMNYAYLLLHFEDVTLYNAQNFLRSVLPGALASVLLLTTTWRIEALVLSLVAGSALGLICAAWGVHRREPLRRTQRAGLYPELLGVGRRLYVAGLIEHLNLYLASLLVGVQLAARELAFFRLGQDRLQVLDQIPSAANSMLYPRIARTVSASDQTALAARCIRVLVLVLGGSALAGAILAPAAVWLLYGTEFMPMTVSIWLLLPGVCALGVTSPTTQYLMGTGRASLIWKLAIVPLVLQVALLWPLIQLAGFAGAAIAVSLSFIAHSFARVRVLSSVTGLSPRQLIVPERADRELVLGFLTERMRPLLAPFRRGVSNER